MEVEEYDSSGAVRDGEGLGVKVYMYGIKTCDERCSYILAVNE